MDDGPACFDEPGQRRMPPAHVDPAASYDTQWRKLPAVPGFIQVARAIPGYAQRFHKRVPDEFVAKVTTDEVDVACPCGGTPRCRWNVPEECGCGRQFAYLAGSVRVAYVQPIDES